MQEARNDRHRDGSALIFGEAALLSGEPRNATVTAVTECTFCKLHRDDLEVAVATQPAIRKAMEEESRRRIEMHLAG